MVAMGEPDPCREPHPHKLRYPIYWCTDHCSTRNVELILKKIAIAYHPIPRKRAKIWYAMAVFFWEKLSCCEYANVQQHAPVHTLSAVAPPHNGTACAGTSLLRYK